MAKLTITGNTQPIVGNTEAYSLSVFDNLMSSNSFSFPPSKVQWNIHVKDQKGWRITHGNAKDGEHITYKFTHKSLKYKALKIEVTRGKDKGELYIQPQPAEEPKILRVDLLDINSQRLQKGKLLHYTDTLIAKAHCVGMFGHKVSFTLWEDDSIGEGHDPVINMMNRINPVPLVGEVDHEGIAKVIFRLPSYTMAVQIANAQVARGDQNEGKTHEYYVTAEIASKHILKASPNVNVANPTHVPEPPKKQKPTETPHAHRKPPVAPEKKDTKPAKPKPKEDTPKFPQTPAARKQADPEGKIISVEFTDATGKPLKNAKTGDIVSIKISTRNMSGKNVKVRIWEEDFSRYCNDLVYEVSAKLAYNTTNFINGVVLTKDMYTKSYEWGEGNEREYFIEVEHLNTSVTSQVIPVSPDAEPVKVEANDSPSIIKEPKQEKKEEKTCECEAKVRAFMRMLRVKEDTVGDSGYEKIVGGKSFIKDYGRDWSTHPDISISIKRINSSSDAAGAYQMMGTTYSEKRMVKYRKQYNITSFDPESQDKMCLVILKYFYQNDRPSSFYNTGNSTKDEWRKRFKEQQGDIIQFIIDDNFKRAVLLASLCWASLPDSPYGQQSSTYTNEDVKKIYEIYLKEELTGKSDLHLKKGFLKEFDYSCCEETVKKELIQKNSSKWRNPIDNPMLCLYSQGGGFKPWHGSFGEKIRDNSANHSGNDLLATPGTKVYACVKSIVHKIYTSGSMAGNVVVLKVLDTETFKSLKRKGYTPKYKSKGEILGRGFNENETIYLTFWHLSKNNFFKEGDEVKYNDVIGLTGISGGGGKNFTTRNPHLHFEVSNVGSASGLNGKCNPSIYFKFKTEDELSKTEMDFQNKLKEKEWK
ncbi:hypothetical protein [Chryseobacterium sp. Marseille-Q3244]|uniref:hypothetical protein n=1 Tax=Chryseobacterium sp. Marseille-Q3244 TaxID=2758092 RepID=UPI0020243955|nr:hypothetical protein [Chryseobacterium sp. Marseille-Q3244]